MQKCNNRREKQIKSQDCHNDAGWAQHVVGELEGLLLLVEVVFWSLDAIDEVVHDLLKRVVHTAVDSRAHVAENQRAHSTIRVRVSFDTVGDVDLEGVPLSEGPDSIVVSDLLGENRGLATLVVVELNSVLAHIGVRVFRIGTRLEVSVFEFELTEVALFHLPTGHLDN